MFKKTIETNNKGAKISAIIALVGGVVAFIISVGENVLYEWVLQTVSIAFFTYAAYITICRISVRHMIIIESTSGAAEDGEGAYDFIVYQLAPKRNGKSETKVCHVSVKHIDFVRVVDAENKREVARDRRAKDKYTYDSQFAAQKHLEVSITNGGEVASIFLTYDEEVLNALLAVGVERKY